MGRATRDWMPRAIFGFGAGIIVGAGLALMLTPRTGAELRNDLSEGANKLVQKGRQQIDTLKHRIEQKRDEFQAGV